MLAMARMARSWVVVVGLGGGNYYYFLSYGYMRAVYGVGWSAGKGNWGVVGEVADQTAALGTLRLVGSASLTS